MIVTTAVPFNSGIKMNSTRIRRFFRIVLKLLAGIVLLSVVAAVIAHLAWKYSGTGKPELVIDRNGVKVYTIKTSGDTLLKVMATRRVDTTMDQAVAAMIDDTVENCHDWNPNCFGSKAVKPWDPKTFSYVQLWTQSTRSPFKTREYLLGVKVTQNPSDKSATVQFHEIPDLLPENDCCVRVQYMRNRWIFKPLDAKGLEANLLLDMDIGIPYFLFNSRSPEGVYGTFEDLPRLFNSPRYDNAKLDWLLATEPRK